MFVLVLAGSIALVRSRSVSIDPKEPPAALPGRVTGRPRPEVPPTFVVRSEWTILRNQPVGLAIGNARKAWGMEVGDPPKYGYVAGFVRGNFRGCAWTTTRNIVSGGGPAGSTCRGFDPPLKSFISRLNCMLCHGGTAVRLIHPADEFANFSPARGPTDHLRSVPAGHCVEWRWVSSDAEMVMVKDRAFPNNQGSWSFVPRSTLPIRLPSGYGSSCRSAGSAD